MKIIALVAIMALIATAAHAQTCSTIYKPSGDLATSCSDGSSSDTVWKPGGYTTTITPPPPPIAPAPYLNPHDYYRPAPPPPADFAPGGAFEKWAPYQSTIVR